MNSIMKTRIRKSFWSKGVLVAIMAVVFILAGRTLADSNSPAEKSSDVKSGHQKKTGNGIFPYDTTCPVIRDNDESADVYTDFYIMSLASAGTINLVGMYTSVPVDLGFVTPEDYERMYADLRTNIAKARESGWKNIPDAARGVKGHLSRPSSGNIDDTVPVDSDGGRLIVQEANKCTPGRPLVILMGGSSSTPADAYLIDHSIADKVVLAYAESDVGSSHGGYNGWLDPWATYICMMKFRMVICSFPLGKPSTPRSKMATDLPASLLRDRMLSMKWRDSSKDALVYPGNSDDDCAPGISLMRPDYAASTRRVAFTGWTMYMNKSVPTFSANARENIIQVMSEKSGPATTEWWRAMTNPAAWKPVALMPAPPPTPTPPASH
jgi:hypothetical protein